jgi:hypothetical protein
MVPAVLLLLLFCCCCCSAAAAVLLLLLLLPAAGFLGERLQEGHSEWRGHPAAVPTST